MRGSLVLGNGGVPQVFGMLVEESEAAIFTGSQRHPHLEHNRSRPFAVAKLIVYFARHYARQTATGTVNDWVISVTIVLVFFHLMLAVMKASADDFARAELNLHVKVSSIQWRLYHVAGARRRRIKYNFFDCD